MPSIPLTPNEEAALLKELRLNSTEDLFTTIPPQVRERARIDLELGVSPDSSRIGMSEHELRDYFGRMAAKNATTPYYRHFLGGGVYDNVIPAIVNQLVLRGEFLTSYTPYQPEISQGTLQVIFEFQTMISRITGMPVANASMYDGATATAEAALMAERLGQGGGKLLIAESTHPDTRTVVNTFLKFHSTAPVGIPFTKAGTTDLTALQSLCKSENPCGVVIPYPNYFGIIEDLGAIRSILPKNCLLIVTTADLSALSIFEAPGNLGADISVGEAQQLGTPMNFGGPHIGFFATKKEYLRQMPGRVCGETIDREGKRAYTLTLSTREQHIRREKATSNICTNQGLIALRTSIYLSFLGKQGFQRLGEMNHSLFEYLTASLESHGIPPRFRGSIHYREGVFEIPHLKHRFQQALDRQLIPGIMLASRWGSEFEQSLLISVNPKHRKEDIDALVEVLTHD